MVITTAMLIALAGFGDSALVCLAPASAQMLGGKSAEAITAVQDAFTGYLTGPTIGVVALKAKLPSQARAEAKTSKCGSVLFATVKQQRSDPGSLLNKVAGRVETQAWRVASTSKSATTRELARTAASTARDVAGAVKAKDQLSLEFRLESIEGAILAKGSDSKKAGSDGEDLLTPLVEKAAEAVATAAPRP